MTIYPETYWLLGTLAVAALGIFLADKIDKKFGFRKAMLMLGLTGVLFLAGVYKQGDSQRQVREQKRIIRINHAQKVEAAKNDESKNNSN